MTSTLVPKGPWANYTFILVFYHLFLAWLVIDADHKTGVSLPIVSTILTHLACLAIILFYGMGQDVIPFYGILRFGVIALAIFERNWLFSANPAKLADEKKKENPVSAENKAAAARAIATATGEDHEAWIQYLAQRDPRLRKPGMSVKDEYEQWLVARVKSRSLSSQNPNPV
jgi:hypothetical protein